VANIEENAKAAEIKLSAEEVASIDKLVHEFKVSRTRVALPLRRYF
jgi:aryl-alcohol dehydrogenase-like predicted oxidoreductase